jgi:uncharacterized protein DUF4381
MRHETYVRRQAGRVLDGVVSCLVSHVSCLLGLATILVVSLRSPAGAQRPSSAIPVQAGVDVNRDTVRVGDPFVVQVGIRAPAGATIEFPQGPDSTNAVQALDPTREEDRPDSSGSVQRWAYYRVAAWDVGEQPIVLGDVVVRLRGEVRRVPLRGHSVFVASVLPADSALRVPKPARPIFSFAVPLWWIWALAALALLLFLLLWWWWRRRRRNAPALTIDPFAQAEREFARIERLGLVEAGERGRYVALMVEVLRDYLAARYEVAPLSLTSTELLAAMRGRPALPFDRLNRLLGEADLIKFAKRPVTPDRARELGRDARAVVAQDQAMSKAVAPAEKAA